MKKHGSVCMLLVRCSIFRVLAVLAGMALVEVGLFLAVLSRGITTEGYSLELFVSKSGLQWVFGCAFLLMTILLCLPGTESGSKCGYTLRRLRVSERTVFFWQSAVNSMFYLLLWLVQILLAVGLSRLYVLMARPEFVSGQTIFLAFYRSDFFHSLLPFEDAGFWVRNAVLVLALGICAARYPHAQRRGRRGQEIIALFFGTVFFFVRGIGDVSCVIAILVALIGAGVSLFRVLDPEVAYEA